ncbi:ROK family protein [Polymorphospora sp. NPDC051019]|uniref:ROK family protein n=1 Tax=Polymorphospora sp. NPDC051019 TaxID=3155725 RepID=UPI0034464AFF
MGTVDRPVVVGLDNGGNSTNATVLDVSGRFLVDRLVETPSRVLEGPAAAVEAMVTAMDAALTLTGVARERVLAVGLDTPGPASADGVISSKGSTNFSQPPWRGYDIRTALADRLGLPVVYNNDGNAAALYAHHVHFGADAGQHSSISAIVGTGLGGGVVESGRVVRGAAGMAGELGHVHIPLHGLLAEGQPIPTCRCGFAGDVESVASLTAIERNLLPYWLGRYPDHPLAAAESPRAAAKLVRTYGEQGDELARRVFDQQAMALGRLFTIAANFTDPSVFFVGGGVVETDPGFREWFLGRIREHTLLRTEQAAASHFALVPDLDMAGARGSAIAALNVLPR